MFIVAPSGIAENKYERVKSDYVLMLLQCIVGSIIIFIPSSVEHRYHIDIPDLMEIIYFIFLFCAIYLGEVRNFYFKIPYWDSILHCFSAAMLGAVGFMIINFLNNSEKLNIQLSPFFVALFAFSFALTCGTIWEVYEFAADGLLGTNMQKFITGNGIVLIGREALTDTMEDFIVDALGALIVAIIGYFDLRKKHIQTKNI
jgi:ABC-type multidrug transport system permease subunit